MHVKYHGRSRVKVRVTEPPGAAAFITDSDLAVDEGWLARYDTIGLSVKEQCEAE